MLFGDGLFSLVVIHAQIGSDAQRLHIGCVIGKDGDPKAGADSYRPILELQGLLEHFLQRMSHVERFGGVRGALQNDGELVTPCSRNGVGPSHAAAEDFGHALQQQVACMMPEGVIYMLKAIQVKHQECCL